MPNQFAISTWTEKSEELIKKIESVFQSIDYPKDELPQTVYDNEKPTVDRLNTLVMRHFGS